MALEICAGKIKVPATVHALEGFSNGCAIVYYHGGGFLYGERGDLPEPYIDMITAAGYTLVAVDYPLAPEWPLECSVELSFQALSQLIEHELAELGCDRYVLFGRSAGGYLALKMAAELASKRPDLQQPAAIWDFYGYWNLEDPFVSTPSAHYAAMPAVDTATVNALTGPSGSLVFEGPKATRFSLYVHARQQGSWGRMLGVDENNAAALSLTREDLERLPPVFITASTGDNDVPLKQSKSLMRAAKQRQMHQVYYLEHDFDRDTANPVGRETYQAALAYLSEVLG